MKNTNKIKRVFAVFCSRHLRQVIIPSFLGVVVTLGFVHLTFAALVSNMSDTMATQAAGETSMHTITLNLSGANTFIAGEQIAIDFPHLLSGFSGGGTWTAADFTFADGTARTIDAVAAGPGVTAAPCVNGANNVGVAVDTAVLTFRVIPCGGMFTPSAAGALITFTINGAAPNGILTNPVVIGNQVISVLNGAGDCAGGGETCKMAVAIVDAPTVSLMVNVTSGGGGGGAPPPPPPAPTITNILATNITGTGAKMTWSTDQGTTSRVNIGTTMSYGTQVNDGAFVTTHTINVSSLAPSTLYHFQVCSTNSGSLQTCSADQTFSTLDQTPPIISAIAVQTISCSGATIKWTTDEVASQFVDYGTSVGPPYTHTTGSAMSPVTNHSVALTGLATNTVYHYRIRSKDTAMNEAFTTDAVFSTSSTCDGPDTKPPVITSVQAKNITDTSATIAWSTDEDADSLVEYGTTNAYGDQVAVATFVKMHTIPLAGLTPNTVYHYRIATKDAANKVAFSLNGTFTTVVSTVCTVDCADTKFVPYIINPDGTERKVGSGFVIEEHPTPGVDRFRFEDKGVDIDFKDVVVTVNRAACGVATFTTELGTTNWHHMIRAEVFYKDVLKKDILLWADSQIAPGNGVTLSYTNDQQICGGTKPTISDVQVSAITTTSARITWTTNKETNSMVNYGSTTSYGTSKFNASPTKNHLVILTDLSEGTKYYFRVRASDATGAVTVSSGGEFTTLSDKIAPANVTGLTVKTEGGQTTFIWTNPTAPDFAGVKIVKKTTGFPSGPNDGETVYEGAGTTAMDMKTTNGVTYFYAVFSYDALKNYSSGAIVSATPGGVPDKIPPQEVIKFSATPGDGRILLQWVNPTDPDFQGVRIMRKLGGFPLNTTDGDVAFLGADTSIIDTNVKNGELYYYTAFTHDVANNFSAGVTATATPSVSATSGVSPVQSVTNVIVIPGDTAVQLLWNNPSDAKVGENGLMSLAPKGSWVGTRIVRNEKNNPSGPFDGTIVYEGSASSFIDTGLTNGTSYYYGIFAYDAVSNFSLGTFVSAVSYKGAPSFKNLTCIDTDGTQNYDVKGMVSANSAEYTDICADETSVRENYCQSGVRYLETHACDVGQKCVAGACVDKNFVLTSEKCGNGICAENENTVSCAVDCVKGTKILTPAEQKVDVKKEEKLRAEDLRFFATSANIPLHLTSSGVRVYAGMAFRVVIPQTAIKKPIKEAFVHFVKSAYIMAHTPHMETAVAAPSDIGTHTLTVQITYVDGTRDFINVPIVSVGRGSVYEVTDTRKNVADARVTLLVDTGSGNFGVWDGAASGQQNPQVTDANGSYAFIVPTGTYKLIAEKTGYLTKETLAFPVATDNVLTTALQLINVPAPLDIRNPESILENATYGVKVATEAASEVINNPFVKKGTSEVGVPAAVAVAVVNVGTASAATATAAPYLFYVYSFLAHPALLISRRRRKKWGVVYNSLTKLPVDLAIVRLLDAKTGRIIRSAVTDKDGRYFFIVKPGEYKILVAKAALVFPSAFLRNQKEDATFIDLYHGEPIVVKEETTITANIPLDPITVTKTPRKMYFEGIGRRFQKSMGMLSILGLVVAAVIVPTPLTFSLLGVNVLMFLLFHRLAVPRKPKNWGIVYDGTTKKPVKNAIARIFEAKYNKLLEMQVTDANGRYAFLVGNNVYYVTYEKPGYFKEQKGPVDLIPFDKKKQEGAKVVAIDVPLLPKKGAGGAAVQASAAPTSVLPPPPPSAGGDSPSLPEGQSPSPTGTVPTSTPPKATPSTSYADQMLARLHKDEHP